MTPPLSPMNKSKLMPDPEDFPQISWCLRKQKNRLAVTLAADPMGSNPSLGSTDFLPLDVIAHAVGSMRRETEVDHG